VSLYVIDNGPEEDLGAVRDALSVWPSEAGNVELIAGHGNVGFGRANNLVLDRLESDFHLVMNPDVEVDRAALSRSLSSMKAHPEVGILAPAAFGPGGEREYLCKRPPSLWVLFLRGFAPRFLRQRFERTIADYEMRDVIGDQFVSAIPLASGCFMLIRTALFRKLGGFDPGYFMYFEDFDLSLRAGRESVIAYEPTVRIVHHGGRAGRKGLRHVAWFCKSGARFFLGRRAGHIAGAS
jgi:GT2 family glycosyltransferase